MFVGKGVWVGVCLGVAVCVGVGAEVGVEVNVGATVWVGATVAVDVGMAVDGVVAAGAQAATSTVSATRMATLALCAFDTIGVHGLIIWNSLFCQESIDTFSSGPEPYQSAVDQNHKRGPDYRIDERAREAANDTLGLDLATQAECESGCFRVLTLVWFPLPA